MHFLALTLSTLLTIPGLADAQRLRDLTFKDGLWLEHTVTTALPSRSTSEESELGCHSMQQERSFKQDDPNCTTTRDSSETEKIVFKSSCSMPLPNGAKGHYVSTITRLDGEHFNISYEVSYGRTLNGATGSSSTMDMTYQGPCPPDMKPGDRRETKNPAGALRNTPLAASAQLTQRPPPPTATSGPPINNADVISLAAAGLDDSIILAKINSASAANFDTSIEGLKALKSGGVSNEVIKVIVGRASASEAQSAQQSDDPNVMHQPGVYVQLSGRDGQLHLLELEHTHAIGENISGNSIALAYGLGKRHTRTSLNGPTSPVRLEERLPIFYIYIPQDTQSFGGSDLSARDFELLKLRIKNKTREVETSASSNTGMGSSGVEDKARQPTVAQKVKPGIYLVKPSGPLKPGEYAFQHELEGVFYDFSISEAR